MAGLKCPGTCPECSSTKLHREYHPERWICDNGHVALTRGSVPQTGICTGCGREKSDEVKFKANKNQCLDCYNAYMKEWNTKNKDVVLAKKKVYYKTFKEKLRKRSNEYYQSTPEIFLSYLVSRTRTCANKFMSGKGRAIPLDHELTKEILIELYNRQGGKCALTMLPMSHKWGDMNTISVDRIDSSKGYVDGNIQLVCKAINLLKNNNSQSEAIEFILNMRHNYLESTPKGKVELTSRCRRAEFNAVGLKESDIQHLGSVEFMLASHFAEYGHHTLDGMTNDVAEVLKGVLPNTIVVAYDHHDDRCCDLESYINDNTCSCYFNNDELIISEISIVTGELLGITIGADGCIVFDFKDPGSIQKIRDFFEKFSPSCKHY